MIYITIMNTKKIFLFWNNAKQIVDDIFENSFRSNQIQAIFVDPALDFFCLHVSIQFTHCGLFMVHFNACAKHIDSRFFHQHDDDVNFLHLHKFAHNFLSSSFSI